MKQSFLPGFSGLGQKEFGGTRLRGNPRSARPLSSRRAIHLVMRSSLAKGPKSFLCPRRAKRIERLVYELGQKKGVKLYRFANSGNHLHFLLLPSSRSAYNAYVRAVSGLIARMVLEAERGQGLGIKFWDARPYTRIVEWGREFRVVAGYVLQNTLEAIGFISYKRRNREKPPDQRRK